MVVVKQRHNLEAVWAGGKKGGSKVEITSLNSHFLHLRLSTKYREYSEVAKVWIKVCNVHSVTYRYATLQTLAFPEDEDSPLADFSLRLLPTRICVMSWLGKSV